MNWFYIYREDKHILWVIQAASMLATTRCIEQNYNERIDFSYTHKNNSSPFESYQKVLDKFNIHAAVDEKRMVHQFRAKDKAGTEWFINIRFTPPVAAVIIKPDGETCDKCKNFYPMAIRSGIEFKCWSCRNGC